MNVRVNEQAVRVNVRVNEQAVGVNERAERANGLMARYSARQFHLFSLNSAASNKATASDHAMASFESRAKGQERFIIDHREAGIQHFNISVTT